MQTDADKLRFQHILRHVEEVTGLSLGIFQHTGWQDHGILFSIIHPNFIKGEFLKPAILGRVKNTTSAHTAACASVFAQLQEKLSDPHSDPVADAVFFKDWPVRGEGFRSTDLLFLCAGAPARYNLALAFMGALRDPHVADNPLFDKIYKLAERYGGEPFRRLWNLYIESLRASA